MLTDSQTSAHEQMVIRIMRRLPAERILQLVDFAWFLELETTNTVLLKFQIANEPALCNRIHAAADKLVLADTF